MNELPILLCGIADDPHLLCVEEALNQKGTQVVTWNSRDPNIFNQIQLTNIARSRPGWHAIWVRHLPPLFPATAVKNHNHPLQNIRKQRAGRSFFLQWLAQEKEKGTRILPSLNEGSYDQNKGNQLRQAQRAGMITPPSLCTNDEEIAWRFIHERATDCVVKPVIGGAPAEMATRKSVATYLQDCGPVFLQERVRGQACRVLCLNGFCLGAYVLPHSEDVDWRTASFEKAWEPLELPQAVSEKIHAFTQKQPFEFLGFDFILNENVFVFLEANPSPSWCDLPSWDAKKITTALAQCLAAPALG